MEFMKKMEEKIFEKFDFELSCKKEIEVKVAQYLEEKFNVIKSDLQKESKTRYDSIENLEYYFEVKIKKFLTYFKFFLYFRKNCLKFKKPLKWNNQKEKKMIITIF
jgi:hypothetical protein